MNSLKRKWELLTDEEKHQFKEDLIIFFESERDEKIGIIAAEELLNFFLQHAGIAIFNKGIEACKKAVTSRLEEIQYDLDDLYLQ